MIEAIGVVATGALEKGKRYSMGLPDEAWRTMTETWKKAPIERRVIQDIDRFEKALDRIIEEDGAYVEEWDVRHGHRKATQQAVKGGAMITGRNVVLTAEAEEGMRVLEERWKGLTSATK